ncbi:MAG: 6-carboxytetrahydropterin synthase QueD [Lachnospiraceae bacterium]|nr:6-carboxytetrahydropterin synthase QueD [Lachnospiraceae bacterium]
MYTLKTNASFDSAHFLKGYEGKCSNIHGHRWTVEILVCGETLEESGSNRGMVVDFSKLKDDVKEVVNSFDHCLIIEKGSLKEKTLESLLEENFKVVQLDFRPTAENFSKYFYDLIYNKGYMVKECTVYETPNNCATYSQF